MEYVSEFSSLELFLQRGRVPRIKRRKKKTNNHMKSSNRKTLTKTKID